MWRLLFRCDAFDVLHARLFCNIYVTVGSCGGREVQTDMTLKKVAYQPGSRVSWAEHGQAAYGIVLKVFTHYLERTMNGATVTRTANRRNPAYLIELDGGDTLLMNHNDLRLAG